MLSREINSTVILTGTNGYRDVVRPEIRMEFLPEISGRPALFTLEFPDLVLFS